MCLYYTIGRNPKYKSNKKNGGIIPPICDNRILEVPFTCGNCIECRKKKAREWNVRLQEDIKHNKNAQFITLTFSNESIREIDEYITAKQKVPYLAPEGYNRDNAIAKTAMRLFLERWRKKYKESVRHWMITELGHKGTENIHMHGLIWTTKPDQIKKIWAYGYVWDGYNKNGKRINFVNQQTINYITKYVNKLDQKNKYYKSKILTSPGMGRNYTRGLEVRKNEYKGHQTDETYRTRNGSKLPMPTYWRQKIYTDEERERLWINKLDKGEMWVMGEKVDVSSNTQSFHNLLDHYRRINTEMGYGDNIKGTAREWAENERRKILQAARIQAGTGLRPEVDPRRVSQDIGWSKAHVANGNNTKNKLPGSKRKSS